MTAEVLTAHARGRLVDELCRLYPSEKDLEIFLSLRLDRPLARLAAPGTLVQVAFDLVRAAEKGGWIRDLVAMAAADSPHSNFLQVLIAAKPPGAAPDIRDEAAARALDLVLIAPVRWSPLAASMCADRRVSACRCVGSADALSAVPSRVDALVVSNEIPGVGKPPRFGTVPAVLLMTGPEPTSWGQGTLSHALASEVTQIVVAGPLAETARRIVDGLVTVVGPPS